MGLPLSTTANLRAVTAASRTHAPAIPATYAGAVDATAAALAPTSTASLGDRLRSLADIGELPFGIRPVSEAGSVGSRTRVVVEVERTESHWASDAAALRRIADQADADDPVALRAARDLLEGTRTSVPGRVLVATLRHAVDEAPLTLLPARLPGELPRPAASRTFESRYGITERYAPSGQLALGSEGARQVIDAARAIGAAPVDSRHRSAAERARVVDVLQRGTNVPGSKHFLVGEVGNDNGQLPVRHLVRAGDDVSNAVHALVKAGDDAPREVFASSVAARLGVDHLVPAAVLDRNGFARIEYRSPVVDGKAAPPIEPPDGRAPVTDSWALEHSVARGYLADLPLADDDQLHELARHDAQLMRAFDYVLANSDRHAGNVLVDADGRVSWIDHGRIADSDYLGTTTTLEPFGKVLSRPGRDKVEQLDRSVVEQLRRSLTSEGLEVDFAASVGLDTAAKRAQLEGMQARLQHMLDAHETRWA